jgi:hypothetical protein
MVKPLMTVIRAVITRGVTKMKGIFWNSNGLRDRAKPRFLFDSVKSLC